MPTRKAKRRPPRAPAAAVQPARFGIEHFFQRHASSMSQRQEAAAQVERQEVEVIPSPKKERKEEEVADGLRKRVVSDDGDPIGCKASSFTAATLQRCTISVKVDVDSNKENVPVVQATVKQKQLQVPSPALHFKDRSAVKNGPKRLGKRKVLLDLLDQVKLVVSDDDPGDDALVVQPASNAVENDSEQRTNICRNANDRNANMYYLVLEASESEYQKEHAYSFYPQKVLRLLDEKSMIEKLVYLRDEWNFSVVRPGDTVNIIGDFGLDGKCVVDHKSGLLVLHPDVLVSGSRVGSSFSCPRRAVFHDRIKSCDTSTAALLGTMLHRLFQAALTCREPTFISLETQAKKIVLDHIDGLYATGGSEKEARTKLVDAIPSILDWLQKFKHSKEPNVDFGVATGKRQVSVSEVVDIEEMIVSPKYGLKGMLDASIRVDEDHMPLELKTGKATTGQAGVEHRAQVILYTLLMSDRYAQDVNEGMLYYLHTNQTLGIQAQHADLTGLLMRRNEHASHLRLALSSQALPPMLRSSHTCQKCPLVDECTVYHKLQEGGTAQTSGLVEVFDALTAHLNSKHGEFLKHWEKLIDLEAQLQFSSQSEIWRSCSGDREERGRCLSSMIISTSTTDMDKPGNVTYCFRKTTSPETSKGPAYDQIFALGDYVLLSTESGYFAVAGGIVRNVGSDSVMVSVSHSLRLPGRNKDPNRVFKEVWRLDRDDSSSSFAIMRYNVLQLLVREGAGRCRELIVDLEAPVFDVVGEDPASCYLNEVESLNQDQRSAIAKVLSARDYCLILGMPGTGKTSTIVHAVRALLARGLSILLASYTNSAVDNILLKLKSQGIDFVRVGRPEAIHADLVRYAIGTDVTSVDGLSLKISQARVVGATCLGVTHALFARRKFDVCIVDEAGQITLPVCLGPLRYARTFVLVGDHYQLPPLIQSPEAREKGMGISLFRKLSEAHPQAVVALQCQYRMSEAIMNLSNALIYGNRLRCGSAEVADARLQVNIPNGLPVWLQQVLDNTRSVVFLDTDNVSHGKHAKYNSVEGSLVTDILCASTRGGVDPRSMGVISAYKAQVDHIRRRVADKGLSDVEVDTIDRYQGRDKDCILISFVLSQNRRDTGSLLTDWHRINVAITRAKKKLIMIGSVKALSSIPLLKRLIDTVFICNAQDEN